MNAGGLGFDRRGRRWLDVTLDDGEVWMLMMRMAVVRIGESGTGCRRSICAGGVLAPNLNNQPQSAVHCSSHGAPSAFTTI
jgi:hypothetical protein